MTRTRRKFTPEERLSILQEAEREGRPETVRKYNIAPSLFDGWKKKYLSEGIAGLKTRYRRIDPQVRQLEEENERLKRIVAKQAIEIEFKTELLKKNPIGTRTK